MKTRRTSPLAAVAPATTCSAGGIHHWAHYNLNRRCWQTCQKCGKTIDHTKNREQRNTPDRDEAK
jgi:hypothetical protein